MVEMPVKIYLNINEFVKNAIAPANTLNTDETPGLAFLNVTLAIEAVLFITYTLYTISYLINTTLPSCFQLLFGCVSILKTKRNQTRKTSPGSLKYSTLATTN